MHRLRKGCFFLLVLFLLVTVIATVAFAKTSNLGISKLLMGTKDKDAAVLQGVFSQAGHVNATNKAQANQTASANLYSVQAGDSLYWIALRYGVSVTGLQQANSITGTTLYPGQYLAIPGVPEFSSSSSELLKAQNKPLKDILKEKGIQKVSNLKIVVDKSEGILSLFSGNLWLKSYPISLGDGGPGDKKVIGDHKTPEGRFFVCQRLVLDPPDKFLGSRWLRLSYPNREDAERGLQQGLITVGEAQEVIAAFCNLSTPPQQTALGGGIGIHGGSVPEFNKNWTWGCVGLTNSDVEDCFDYIEIGTPVIIIP